MVYITLFRSIMYYGLFAFGCTTNSTKEKLDVIEGHGLRIGSCAMPRTSRGAHQNDLGDLPLHVRRLLQTRIEKFSEFKRASTIKLQQSSNTVRNSTKVSTGKDVKQ